MGKRGKILREKGDDFSGRRRRFRGRRGMILKRGEGKDLEGGGGRLGRGNKKIFLGGRGKISEGGGGRFFLRGGGDFGGRGRRGGDGPRTTKYWPVPPNNNPVLPDTDQYYPILTQNHQVQTSSTQY